MSAKSQAGGHGIGLGGAVIVLFVGLKLTGHIDWSWWWVLSPAWIGLGLSLLVVMVAMLVVFVATRGGGK